MKYKMLGIFSCLCLLGFSFFLSAGMIKKENRYHQHKDKSLIQPVANSVETSLLETHLPIIKINVDEDIPGAPISNGNNVTIDFTKSKTGETNILGHFSVIDNKYQYNNENDTPCISTLAKIHIRGHSSRHFDKKGYSIKLVDEKGNNAPKSLLGMPQHHEWVLHGPFLDKTLIRNYMWYNISGEIMYYSPEVRFCELIINDKYEGLYVLTERITAGKNCRLNLHKRKWGFTFSSYLLRVDRGARNEYKNISTFSDYTGHLQTRINIEYPGILNLNQDIKNEIITDFSSFEKSLYSYDFQNKKYGWPAKIDEKSFIDYFLINELTCNYDAGSLSTYIYKEPGQKYKLCVWDFNNSCDLYYEGSMIEPQKFQLHTGIWYDVLLSDRNFTNHLIKRYKELRETYFSDEYLENYIDETIKYLGPAIDRDIKRWGYAYNEEYDLLIPKERNPRSFDEAVYQMKNFLKERTKWLDENIEILSQYSADAINKWRKIELK